MNNCAHYALSIGVAAALLSGCGSQTAYFTPKAISQNTAVVRDPSQERLFVTEYTRNTVLVYNASAKNPRIRKGTSRSAWKSRPGTVLMATAHYM